MPLPLHIRYQENMGNKRRPDHYPGQKKRSRNTPNNTNINNSYLQTLHQPPIPIVIDEETNPTPQFISPTPSPLSSSSPPSTTPTPSTLPPFTMSINNILNSPSIANKVPQQTSQQTSQQFSQQSPQQSSQQPSQQLSQQPSQQPSQQSSQQTPLKQKQCNGKKLDE